MTDNPLVIIIGPTASGKTRLAASVASILDGEIISADSRQAFKHMDIGTGKDLSEYIVGDQIIPYHLINIKEAGEKYNVNFFKEDFYQAYAKISAKSKLPILCGGTGMYVHSLLQDHRFTAVPVNEPLRISYLGASKSALQDVLLQYSQHLRASADFSSAKRLIRAIEIADYLQNNELEKIERIELNPLVIGLKSELNIRRSNVLERLDLRIKSGLIEEVIELRRSGVSDEMLIFYGLEYKFVISYLNGTIDLDTLKERLGTAICQFAKRQMTFFRKMEKDGVVIHWLNIEEGFEQVKKNALELINASFRINK